MSKLPKGWVEDEASAICELVQSGGTPKEGFIDKPGVPFLKVYNIVDQKIDFEYRPQFIDVNIHRSSMAKSQAFPGDVLMNIVGPPLGKVAVIPNSFPTWNVNQALTIFRPSEALTSEWLYYFLCGGDSVKSVINETRGSAGQVNISLSQCRAFELPLPPLAEQKRIVAKLDALSAKSDRARIELARIDMLVSRYKQAVLSKAFSGELTSGLRQEASGTTPNEDPDVTPLWSVPETWSWCRTDQAGRVGLGRQRSPKNHEGPHMRPYLRSANITWQGVDTSDVKEMNFDDADFKRFQLEVGDVLLNEGSGSAKEVGKPAIWRGEIADCCYQNTLLRVQPHRCSSEYAYYYFLLTARAGRFVSSTQGVNIQHIGREGLACYPFPLAPEPEQHEIVRRIEFAFAKIDRLAIEAGRALQLLGKLDEAILAKAFRGELVPQDENDEPAEKLLERIRTERETAPRATRRTRNAPSKLTADRKRTTEMAKMRDDVEKDHLSQILRVTGGAKTPRDLWLQSGMEIDEFYKQLRSEMDLGQIREGTNKDQLELVDAR